MARRLETKAYVVSAKRNGKSVVNCGTDHSKVNILYCNTMRNYELQTQNNYNCLTIDTVATMYGLITYASYVVNNQY